MYKRSIHFSRQCFADAAAQETALLGWSQRYSQLNSGHYAGEVETLSLPGISIVRERVNLALAQETASPIGTVVFVCSLANLASWRINAASRGTGTVSLYRGGTEVTAVAPPRSDILITVIDTRLLGIEPGDVPAVKNLDGTPETEATKLWLASLLAVYGDRAHVPHELDALLPGLVTDRLLDLYDRIVRHGSEPTLSTGGAHDIYRRSVRLVEADHDPLSVVELAAELGVPTATLREAFMDTVGVSPSAWLRQQRLEGARRDLAQAAGTDVTVSEIAMKWGFWHLGRFAAYYAQRYGHVPSDILRARAQ